MKSSVQYNRRVAGGQGQAKSKVSPKPVSSLYRPFQAQSAAQQSFTNTTSKGVSNSSTQKLHKQAYNLAISKLTNQKSTPMQERLEEKSSFSKSRNQEHSLQLKKNQLHSMSSKGLLSTKLSNQNQFSTDREQHPLRLSPQNNFVSGRESYAQKAVSQFQSGQSFAEASIKSEEGKQRRDSSCNQSDIDEMPKHERNAHAVKVKKSIVNKHLFNCQEEKQLRDGSHLKERIAGYFISQSSSTIKNQSAIALVQNTSVKKNQFLQQNEKWMSAMKQQNFDIRRPSQDMHLSRIDNEDNFYDSKASKSELEFLANFSKDYHQKNCKDMLCCFTYKASYPQDLNHPQEQGESKASEDGMIRVDSQQDRIELSLPVDLDEMNEDHSSSHITSSPSNGSQGIKSYLNSLKRLRGKYKEICQELIQEENSNIQQTLQAVLESEEFRRMSVQSKTQLLSGKIIEIREEYRNVLQLLKTQHNFDADFENDDE